MTTTERPLLIPSHRPVTGADLDVVRQSYGLLMADACFLFGLSPNKWMELVRKNPNEPIADATLALLVRFLDQHPELSLIPRWPDVQEMFDLMKDAKEDLTREQFSIQLGFERTAATRWFLTKGRQTAGLSRLLYCFREVLTPMDKLERKKLVDDWLNTVSKEAETRGVPDIFNKKTGGRWPTKAANDEDKDKD